MEFLLVKLNDYIVIKSYLEIVLSSRTLIAALVSNAQNIVLSSCNASILFLISKKEKNFFMQSYRSIGKINKT